MQVSIEKLFTEKVIIKLPIWVIVFTPLLFYSVWEFFWLTQAKWNFITWHTHLMIFVYLWFLGFVLFALVVKDKNSERFKVSILLFSSVIFALFAGELCLQISGINKTYLEKISGFYSSPYTAMDKSHYHKWPTDNSLHLIKKVEYEYEFPTNSLGLPDREWNEKKDSDEIRILTLGDSFTEGDGAPYDSSYPAHLRDLLMEAGGNNYYLMNGGVCGSDPYFNFVDLRNRIIKYKPDIILQNLSSQDMLTDILLRGGMERFLPNGKQQFKNGPWWEPIYAISYISRFYFHSVGYNELLRKGEPSEKEIREMNAALNNLFTGYANLCKKHGIKLIVFLRPAREEIMRDKYDYDFTPIINHLHQNHNVEFFDLLPFYQKYIKQNNSDVRDYFWVYDGHHNAKGYRMMAETVFEALKEKNPQFFYSEKENKIEAKN